MALVYDVGMHKAEDTRYYLSQGHRVIAIEANPELVRKAAESLARHLRSGQLTLLNTIVDSAEDPKTLWVPETHPQWGSIDRKIAERVHGAIHKYSVSTSSIQKIIADYGRPDYVKVDIESSSMGCLKDLLQHERPAFVSVECECLPAEGACSSDVGLELLAWLSSAGYHGFKLVDQYSLLPISREMLCPMQQYLASSRKDLRRRLGWYFPFGSSGPWGEQLSGNWLDPQEAAEMYVAARSAFFGLANVPPYGFWVDWHARRV